MVTDTEDRELDDEESVMLPLIYLEDSDDEEGGPPPGKPRVSREDLSEPPSAEPTSEPGPPSKKTTEEPTSEPKYDVSSDHFAPQRKGCMDRLDPGDMVRYQKGVYKPRVATLEERIKETSWRDTWNIKILSQS